MESRIKDITKTIRAILIGAAFVLVAVILSPIILIFCVLVYFQNSTTKEKYLEYLRSIEGTKLFCYNSRANYQSYIRNNIIPLLPKDVKLVYLDGKVPVSEYEQQYISHALYNIKDRKGFPYLLKIHDGQLVDQSINNEFYNTMNQNKDVRPLLEKIESFYKTT